MKKLNMRFILLVYDAGDVIFKTSWASKQIACPFIIHISHFNHHLGVYASI